MCLKTPQTRTLLKTKRYTKNGVVTRTVRTYKVTKPRTLQPGDRHPVTGITIPSPTNKAALYPGKGYCRTVKVKKVTTYKTDSRGRRIKVGTKVVSRTPVSGWHQCKPCAGK